MMWNYNETPEFVHSSEKLNLSELVRESLEAWSMNVGRVSTNKTTLCFRSPNNKFEIWVARIPDPDSNKGSSGGFRLVYFFKLDDSSIHLDLIEARKNLGFKKEKPREKQKFTAYLKELKLYLLKELED